MIVNLPIVKRFGVDFHSEAGALTLNVSEVSDADPEPEGGVHTRTHADGWTITGRVHEDYFTWVNEFEATHRTLGRVAGDFEGEVRASSEEAFADFYEKHGPHAWDYAEI